MLDNYIPVLHTGVTRPTIPHLMVQR